MIKELLWKTDCMCPKCPVDFYLWIVSGHLALVGKAGSVLCCCLFLLCSLLGTEPKFDHPGLALCPEPVAFYGSVLY